MCVSTVVFLHFSDNCFSCLVAQLVGTGCSLSTKGTFCFLKDHVTLKTGAMMLYIYGIYIYIYIYIYIQLK